MTAPARVQPRARGALLAGPGKLPAAAGAEQHGTRRGPRLVRLGGHQDAPAAIAAAGTAARIGEPHWPQKEWPAG
jgi:hypothetical protein